MTATYLELGDLPPGTTDADVDGPEYAPEPRREAKKGDFDQFCGEDLQHLFEDWHADLNNRHHAEAFGRKVAELWDQYKDRNDIR